MKRPKYFAGMRMMNQMIDMKGNLDPSSMGGMKMQSQIMDMNTVMYPEITGEETIKAKYPLHQPHHFLASNAA